VLNTWPGYEEKCVHRFGRGNLKKKKKKKKKRPLERSRRRWEDNVKIYINEIL